MGHGDKFNCQFVLNRKQRIKRAALVCKATMDKETESKTSNNT